MTWHIENDIFSLVVFLFIYMDMRGKQFIEKKQDKAFRVLTVFTIVCGFLDLLSCIVIDFPPHLFLYHLVNTAYFTILPLIPVAWYYYIEILVMNEDYKRAKWYDIAATVPYLIYFAVSISTPFTGLIYSVSENMEYERGPLFFATILMFVIYTVATLILELIHFNTIMPRRRFWLILTAPIIFSAGIVAQICLEGVLAIFPAYTIAYLLIYLSIQSRRTLLDGLTGINSRITGENLIKDYLKANPDASAAFIITDIDSFKRVNDTLSHLFGDNVLAYYTKTLVRSFPQNSVITRYGGDEFVIFVPEYGSREALTDCMKRVLDEMAAAFTLDESLTGMSKITVSMGVALIPDNGRNYIELYENSDAALYYAKSKAGGSSSEMFQPHEKIAFFGGCRKA